MSIVRCGEKAAESDEKRVKPPSRRALRLTMIVLVDAAARILE